MSVRKTLVMVLVLAAASFPLSAATAPDASQSGATLAPAASFSIRFYDQKVYFVGDPIRVEAVVANTGTDTLRFKVADNRFFNLDFDVRTTTNLGLDHARQFITERNSDQPTFFREVSLEPGEKYSVVVDLQSFTAFGSAGQYVLQGAFYPELFRGPDSSALKSNRLTLNLKPALATAEERAVVEAETGALLARLPLPPDEVVSSTIQARQKSQWERFYLYLDLETILRKSPEKDRAWRNATEAARQKMMDSFRLQLRQTNLTQDISVIPTTFEIQKTSYNATDGTVEVLERFAYPGYTERKLYTYHLKKVDRSWIIDDYEIRNQGTE
jgi:hypothetical protein